MRSSRVPGHSRSGSTASGATAASSPAPWPPASVPTHSAVVRPSRPSRRSRRRAVWRSWRSIAPGDGRYRQLPLGRCVRGSYGRCMAVEVAVDTALLKREIKKTYAAVSPELAAVPDAAAESFAGVANPWELGRLSPGERVLDLGCGAGTDSLVAAQMVGPEGLVTGIDMTPEMLVKARSAATEMGAENVDFVEGEIEALPFPDETFDVVISNGVVDLVPDKDAVFEEIYRVLAPGGRIQIADVTIQNPVS